MYPRIFKRQVVLNTAILYKKNKLNGRDSANTLIKLYF